MTLSRLVGIRKGIFYDPQSDSQYWTLTLRTAAEHNCALCLFNVINQQLKKSFNHLIFSIKAFPLIYYPSWI